MHSITIPLSEQILAGFKYLGADGEHEQLDMARRMVAEYLDDIALGGLATASMQQGFVGIDEGDKWLQGMKNAED